MDQDHVGNADSSRKQHKDVELELKEIDTSMSVTPELERKMDSIFEKLKEHMIKEETVDLVELKNKESVEKLHTMGKTLDGHLKVMGPMHPHPVVQPMKKFASLEGMIGVMAAPLDRLSDMLRVFPSQDELKEVESA